MPHQHITDIRRIFIYISMSWCALNEVTKDRLTRGNERVVLILLANECRDEGFICWPSIARLATSANISTRTVQRCIDRIEKLGAVKVVESRDGRRSNTYEIVQNSLRGGVILTPLVETDRGDTAMSPTGVNSVTPTGVTAMTPEPVIPRIEPEERKSQRLFDDVDVDLCEHLLGKIRRVNPKHKPPDLQKWAQDMNAIRRKDKRTPEEVRSMIDWAHDVSDFWGKNILSPAKLRKQFDTLLYQSSKSHQKQLPANHPGLGRPIF